MNCQINKSRGGKQLVRRLVQVLFGSAGVREVANKLAGQFVYVDAPKIVELLTTKTENRGIADRRDVDALAVEDVSVHDWPPPRWSRHGRPDKVALVDRQ
jgi:hypothetical protein